MFLDIQKRPLSAPPSHTTLENHVAAIPGIGGKPMTDGELKIFSIVVNGVFRLWGRFSTCGGFVTRPAGQFTEAAQAD
jgi:hypothetical protein